MDTKASAADVQRWLAADDPRLVAWGAYFGAKNADDSAATEMARQAERWPGRGEGKMPAGREQTMAMLAILDALIVRREPVSAAGVAAVAGDFPVQAAILASRLTQEDRTPVLLDWFGVGERTAEFGAEGELVRVAAMMLAKQPPPGFAARVLEGIEVRLRVSVEDPGHGSGFGDGGGSSCCGDKVASLPPKDWPPLFSYRWEENKRDGNDPVLVEVGGDRITYRRSPAYGGGGSCLMLRPLTDETRRHLVAEMSGGAVDWKVQEHASITWLNEAQVLWELRGLVDAEEAKLRATQKALTSRGWMTETEAVGSRPRLAVTVVDERTAGGGALPELPARGGRTEILYVAQALD